MSNYQNNFPVSWRVRLSDGQHIDIKTQFATTNACGALVLSNGAGQIQRVLAAGHWQDAELIDARASVTT